LNELICENFSVYNFAFVIQDLESRACYHALAAILPVPIHDALDENIFTEIVGDGV
jgi:hypothetical protein